MRNFIVVALLFVGLSSTAQNLNQYQYAIVSSQFAFLDGPDQFRLNTMTKAYLESLGFVAYLDNEIIPQEVAMNNCDNLFVDVLSSGSMFTSKLNVIVRDCTNNILFTSLTGSSREKDNSVAYRIALKEAFDSFKSLNYKFDPKAKIGKNEVVKEPMAVIAKVTSDDLTAKVATNGYNVVDDLNNVVLVLKNSSAEGVFFAQGNSASGIFFNKMGKWHFEYYNGNKLISEVLNVKF